MTQAAVLAASGSPGTTTGFKNRIINGNMVIDQRNGGSSITVGTGFSVDRWNASENTSGVATIQQSTNAPAGFTNSIVWTTTTADASLAAGEYGWVRQLIEGYNLADLGWGTANAKTITLSFWVRSSLTGTFGGALTNGNEDRSYPFSYTITSADTWEQKTITVAGDTTGTWNKTNDIGMRVWFGMGVGSDYSGTANAWTGSLKFSVTGAVNVLGTLSATWYLTGVQLEVGTTATNFDFRSIGQETLLCQRYYYKIYGDSSYTVAFASGVVVGTDASLVSVLFPVIMRATPTSLITTGTGSNYYIRQGNVGLACTAVPVLNGQSPSCVELYMLFGSGGTQGNGCTARFQTGTNAFLGFSAEL